MGGLQVFGLKGDNTAQHPSDGFDVVHSWVRFPALSTQTLRCSSITSKTHVLDEALALLAPIRDQNESLSRHTQVCVAVVTQQINDGGHCNGAFAIKGRNYYKCVADQLRAKTQFKLRGMTVGEDTGKFKNRNTRRNKDGEGEEETGNGHTGVMVWCCEVPFCLFDSVECQER